MRTIMYMDNDSSLSIIGFGNIRLRMFDRVVRIIKCWHVA